MDKESLLKSVNAIKGVQGSMLVSKDGLVLVNSMPDSVDPNLISAVLSSMFTNIDVQSKRMQRGKLKRFFIETDQETISLVEVDANGDVLLIFSQFDKDIDFNEVNAALENVTKV